MDIIISSLKFFDLDELFIIIRATIEELERVEPKQKPYTKVVTEKLGKEFEMAICLAYGIKWGAAEYKYDMEFPRALQRRLAKLPELFSSNIEHTAKNGGRYDFTCINDPSKHLSAKTNKKNYNKVAAQGGQAQAEKFCEELGIPFTSNDGLKLYLQSNNNILQVLDYLTSHTFDCPNLYYREKRNTIRYIEMVIPIDWSKMKYEWTRVGNDWDNSSTLKIKIDNNKSIPIVEFQFHSKNRTNMAIRWVYDNVLIIFKDNFSITHL